MPKLVTIDVGFSASGDVSIVDFGKLKSGYHITRKETWDVSDLTTEEAEEYRAEREQALKEAVEEAAFEELKWRIEELDNVTTNANGARDRWTNNA